MDCQMPVMDGYEAATAIREIQAKHKVPRIKMLGLSGNSGSENVKKVQDAGMDNLITKPISIDQIIKLAKETLAEYK